VASALTQGLGFNPSNDRGVFVFGSLVLDFRRHTEVFEPSGRLRDCSTTEAYCADGDIFNVAVPRICAREPILSGAVWSHAGIETTVIARGPDERGDPHRPRATRYYLHSNVRPNLVFSYSPERGITKIYFDYRNRVNFVELARAGSLHQFDREASGDPLRASMVKPLITLDAFAPCLPRR
jgi:hypothetical protein